MRTTRPVESLLKLETYTGEPSVEYSLVGAEIPAGSERTVSVPVSIAYRLYFLARAFDGQVIRHLEPRSSSVVEYANLQRLVSEFGIVEKAVSDPVSAHYLGLLLPLLKESAKHPRCSLRMRAP